MSYRTATRGRYYDRVSWRRPNPLLAALASIKAHLACIDTRLTSIETKVTKIMGLVQVEQDDLTAVATAIETESATINAAFTTLQGYIQQLIAGQATPLPAADETALNQALTDLGTSVTNLGNLQPPTPAPTP